MKNCSLTSSSDTGAQVASLLKQLYETEKIQTLLDDLQQAVGIRAALMGCDGRLVAAGSHNTLCGQYFLAQEHAYHQCVASRCTLAKQAEKSRQICQKTCPHGLTDAVVPLIANDHCLGYLILGQVFLEPPNLDTFRGLAEQYGFDQEPFLEAVMQVPVLSREQFARHLKLMTSLVSLLVDKGIARREADENADKLRETALLLNQSQQIAQVGGWKANPKTGLMQWTDQIYRLLELPRGEIVSLQEALERFPVSHKQELAEKLRHAWENGQQFVTECELQTGSGRHIWVDFRCLGRVTTERGDFLAGTIQDITARKQLEESSRHWQQVFEKADFGLALSDEASKTFIAVNPAYARQRGYGPEELVGKSIFTVYAPEVQELVSELIKAEEGNDHVIFETVQICRDGRRFPARVELTTIRDTAGQAVSRVSCTFDITEQKKHAERSVMDIRRQKAQLRLYAMKHNSCDELLDSALEETLALSDSSIGSLFFYDEDARLFTLYAWSKGVMPQVRSQGVALILELDEAGPWGEAVRQRGPVRCNDGHASEVAAFGYPMGRMPLKRHLALPIFRNNQIVAVLWVANKERDYSDNDIRQLQLFMEGAWNVLERYRAVEALQVARELAEEANRVKTELLANLSHELRTPLNGVIGGAQLLGFTELTPEQDEYLELIDISAANELTLINNLLELVKLESEGIVVEHQPFSLRQAVEEALLIHEGAARAKGLQCALDISGEIPASVVGDGVRIRQILYSLIGNAVKFTDTGGITVGLEVVSADQGHCLARFWVSDTGVGVAPEKLEHIFGLFNQSDTSNTRKYGGLGLGLSLCRRLATAVGGRLWVESEPKHGSTFYLEVPVGVVCPLGQHGAGDALTILLAEDDSLSALASAALLRKLGHAVTVAINGEDAVIQWRCHHFDLVLMDVQMPRMNGFEAVRQIREQEQQHGRSRTPVIAQTAYARWNYRESFLSAQFDDFITKPLLLDELEALIARVADGQAGLAAARAD